MNTPDLGDTQPTPVKRVKSPSEQKSEGRLPQKKREGTLSIFVRLGLFLVFLFAIIILGALAGAASGRAARQKADTAGMQQSLVEQFDLAVEDLNAGRLPLAIQRFEYILNQDPSFPGVTEKMAEALKALYLTSTPPPAPTATLTPTPDMRPIEEMFADAENRVRSGDWDGAIQVLVSLRKANPDYQSTRVDGLMYLSLRFRGLKKILQDGALEGGMFDLSLAERFAPLDGEAEAARQWARLYIYGLAFWEVDPKQAVEYFRQVAEFAPYLHDGSGWTSLERYREALVQYGDLLARQSAWCDAQFQYEAALSIAPDAALQEKYEQVATACLGPTATEEPATATSTPTIGLPGASATPTWTSTAVIGASATPSPSPTASPTLPQASPSPSPSATATQAVTPTPTSTSEPTANPASSLQGEQQTAQASNSPLLMFNMGLLVFLFFAVRSKFK